MFLAEVLEARNSDVSDAVNAHEHRYGVAPEAPFPATTVEGEPSIEPIPEEKFERLSRQGRLARKRLTTILRADITSASCACSFGLSRLRPAQPARRVRGRH